jgi:hypothetical protein
VAGWLEVVRTVLGWLEAARKVRASGEVRTVLVAVLATNPPAGMQTHATPAHTSLSPGPHAPARPTPAAARPMLWYAHCCRDPRGAVGCEDLLEERGCLEEEDD